MFQHLFQILKCKPQLVIFDWDNTLADSRALTVKIMDHILAEHGIEPWDISKKKYRDVDKSFKNNFSNFFGDQAEKIYQTYSKRYLNDYQKYITEIPGALRLLEKLTAKGIPLIIISNKDKVMLDPSVTFLFPDIPFLKILGHDDAPRSKPHPDLVYEAVKNTPFHPKKDLVWFIGDSIHDIECAYASGCQPILIGKGNSTITENYLFQKINSRPPLGHIEKYDQLIEYLELFL